MKAKKIAGLVLMVLIASSTSSFASLKNYENRKHANAEVILIQNLEPQKSLEKPNIDEIMIRNCKATVRGIRCADKMTFRANKLRSANKKLLVTEESKFENCKATTRGIRCMNKSSRFLVNKRAADRPNRNFDGSCRLSARGSRCKI